MTDIMLRISDINIKLIHNILGDMDHFLNSFPVELPKCCDGIEKSDFIMPGEFTRVFQNR